jgi:signal transduction histidine kinase
MSLRRASVVFAVVVALVAVGLAVAMMVMTTRLHQGAHDIRAAAEGLRVGEELEFGLVALRDAPDAVSREMAEDLLHRRLAGAEQYAETDHERAVLKELTARIDTYIEASERVAHESNHDPTPDTQETRTKFDAAFAAVRDWTAINSAQGRAVRVIGARLDWVASLVSAIGVALIVLGIGGMAWWLRRDTFVPALQLVGVIERYTRGERDARADESGATELRTIAHQFNDMASTLQRQHTNQLTFLAGVAHDLRNPLAALKLGVAMVPQNRPLPPEPRIRLLFARCGRQVDRLERMVYDLLDASRIDAGNLALALEPCDVRDLVGVSTDLLEPMMGTRKLVVQIPDQPVVALCDPTRIEQVLSNLLSNAIKYSSADSIITVRVTREADSVVVAVSDQGIGISTADLTHIFEPFHRAGRTASSGLGLGLYVSRMIVRAHGGDLVVASVLGAGSTFTLRLPSGAEEKSRGGAADRR